MADLKEQVLALPEAEKREIYQALQSAMQNEPIAAPLLEVLEDRRRAYRAGEIGASDADSVFGRLFQKHSCGETHDH